MTRFRGNSALSLIVVAGATLHCVKPSPSAPDAATVDQDAGSQADPVAEAAAYCTEYSTAVCDALTACGELRSQQEIDSCLGDFGGTGCVDDAVNRIVHERYGYNRDAGAACAARIRNLPCFLQPGRLLMRECFDALGPTARLGEECHGFCAEGRCTGTYESCGICVPALRVGEVCPWAHESWWYPSICEAPAHCENYVCSVRNKPDGAACSFPQECASNACARNDGGVQTCGGRSSGSVCTGNYDDACAPSLYCKGTAYTTGWTDGICSPKVPDGAACDPNEYVPNAQCANSGSVCSGGICQDFPSGSRDAGEDCFPWGDDCFADLICKSSGGYRGICESRTSADAGCAFSAPSFNECEHGLQCQSQTRTCQPYGHAGAPCGSPFDCVAPLNCAIGTDAGGICQAPAQLGEPCRERYYACAAPYWCALGADGGTCMPKQDAGAWCPSENPRACLSGVCSPYEDGGGICQPDCH